MFDRSTVACLLASMALVATIFIMAFDSYRNVAEYLDTVNSQSIATCTYEDGSAPSQRFPCLWDASLQGNGLGDSYILHTPTDIEYLDN